MTTTQFGTPGDQSLAIGISGAPMHSRVFVNPGLPSLSDVQENARAGIAQGLLRVENGDGSIRIIRRDPKDDVLLVPEKLVKNVA